MHAHPMGICTSWIATATCYVEIAAIQIGSREHRQPGLISRGCECSRMRNVMTAPLMSFSDCEILMECGASRETTKEKALRIS